MKAIATLLFLLTISVICQAQNGDNFIELTAGDTVYGNIWGVEPTQLRFQAKGHEETVLVALQMVESYRRNGEIVHVGGELKIGTDHQLANIYPEQEKLHIAGLKLQKSANLFYAGAAVTVVGTAVSIIGAIITKNSPKTGPVLTYTGSGVAIVGTFISMSAFIPISEAGIQLQKVKLGK